MKRLLNQSFALAVLIFTALFFVSPVCQPGRLAQAAWIDDWIQQKTTTNADYLEGQKRGFATFGGFSARWSTGNDYLVSVTPPQFKAGCGGIDVFLGGFSFLNADYLVQKLQNMLSAAPAVAFDMALNTLCSQCSKAIKSLEAESSRLNQLQFDDCTAAKTGVVLLKDMISSGNAMAALKSKNVSDFLVSSGLQDMWESVKDLKETLASQTPGDVAQAGGASGMEDMVSGCPAIVSQVFFTEGSLLDHLASLRGYDLSYADLMRGYVGDVNVVHQNHDYLYQLVVPCPENTPDKIGALVEGDVYERATPSGSCTKVTSITVNGASYPSIRAWVFSMLSNICNRMTAAAALTAEQENFLKPIPTPVYRGIFADIQAQGAAVSCSQIADMYADSVAAAYAYHMITDFYDTIDKAIMTADAISANKQGAQNPGDSDHCKVEHASDGVNKLKKVQERLPRYIQAAREQYGEMLSALLSHKEYAAKVQEFTAVVRQALSGTFNEGTADRVLIKK